MSAHKEIEVKFPLTESEYRDLLKSLSQKLPRLDLTQDDFVIKTKSDENVRVRVENDIAVLTHKRRIYDDKGRFLYCHESECVIDKDHIGDICEILKGVGVNVSNACMCEDVNLFREYVKNALDLQTLFQVRMHKNRVEFKKENYTYVVDEVKNLGYFLEIEQLVPLEDKTSEIELRQALCQKLLKLGLSERAPLLKGYAVLMHEKNEK